MPETLYYKGGPTGEDVFKTSTIGQEGTKIELPEFKEAGINFTLLGSGAKEARALAALQDTETKAARSTLSTGSTPLEVSAADVAKSLNQTSNFSSLIGDVKSRLSARDAQVADAAALLVPTDEEKRIQSELLGLKQEQQERIEKVSERGPILRSGAEREISNIEGGFTPESLVNLRRQTFATQRLTLLENQRSNALEALKFKVEQGKATTDDLFKLITLDQQQSQFLATMADKLTDNARNTLTTLLSNFKGLRLKDLSPETSSQLTKVAQAAGISLDVLKAGLDAVANQQERENLIKEASIPRFSATTDGTGNIRILDTRTGKLTNAGGGIGGGGPISGTGTALDGVDVNAYNRALTSAGLGTGISKDERILASQELSRYLNAGDIKGAQQFIVRMATVASPTDQQNQAQGRLEALASLTAIKGYLDEYVRKTGDTNILRGSLESAAQKIGASTDPQLAFIANQISQSFINYRKSMSGVAFSPQESKEYRDIFPSIDNVAKLNAAKLDSLVTTMNRNQKVFLESKIGAGNYDKIFPTVLPGSDLKDEDLEAEFNSLFKTEEPKKAEETKVEEKKKSTGVGDLSGVSDFLKDTFSFFR